MFKNSSKIIVASLLMAFSILAFSQAEQSSVLTQEKDWQTAVINNDQSRAIISYTSNNQSGMMGASCEFNGQQYTHVHFFHHRSGLSNIKGMMV